MPWPVTPDAPKTRAVRGVELGSEVIVVRDCMVLGVIVMLERKVVINQRKES